MGEKVKKRIEIVDRICEGCEKPFRGSPNARFCIGCKVEKRRIHNDRNYSAKKTDRCKFPGCGKPIFPNQHGCIAHIHKMRPKREYEPRETNVAFDAAITAQKILQKAGITKKFVQATLLGIRVKTEGPSLRLCSRAELERRIAMEQEKKLRDRRTRFDKEY